MALTREQIAAACKREIQTFAIPGLGDICMRAVTGAEVRAVSDRIDPQVDIRGYTRAIAAATACDEVGDRMPELEALLNDAPIYVVNAVIDAALTINHMKPEAIEDARKD